MFIYKEEASCNIVTHSFARMEDTQLLKLHYVAAMAHQEVFQQQLNIQLFMRGLVGGEEEQEHVASG